LQNGYLLLGRPSKREGTSFWCKECRRGSRLEGHFKIHHIKSTSQQQIRYDLEKMMPFYIFRLSEISSKCFTKLRLVISTIYNNEIKQKGLLHGRIDGKGG
jgi:hypothetical protein